MAMSTQLLALIGSSFATACLFVALLYTAAYPSRVVHVAPPGRFCFADQEGESCAKAQWRPIGPADPEAIKQLVFAIKHPDSGAIGAALERVSEPDSPHYGAYLDIDQMSALSTNHVGYAALVDWLSSEGITEFDPTINHEFVVVRVPASKAADMLKTTFESFANDLMPGVHYVRTRAYSLPTIVSAHIDFVGGTIDTPTVQPQRGLYENSANMEKHGGPIIRGYVTPQLLNNYYNIDDNNVHDKRATQSVFESLGQDFSAHDLTMFQTKFNLPIVPVHEVIGPNEKGACKKNPAACGEANLDVQYIMAIAQNADTTYWSIPDGDGDIFTDWAVAVCNATTPPLVHSISYGSIEQEGPTLHRFNEELQKMGVRGLTVVVSSGDDGVGNFIMRNNPQNCGFHPSFPATSPFVTAVGATQGPEVEQTEIACSSDTGGIITSGGGFSTVFQRPVYQSAAVQAFLDASPRDAMPPDGAFNAHGRAYPDVSLLGFNYIITDGGQFSAESGTSASAPVFAGMLTLINGELMSRGHPPVGFVNPLLYRLSTRPGVFNDITSGSNKCGAGQAGQQVCCPHGFSATRGFDPVTGLGSIHYVNLRNAIVSKSFDQPQMIEEEEPVDIAVATA